jgi:hypothetical protein
MRTMVEVVGLVTIGGAGMLLAHGLMWIALVELLQLLIYVRGLDENLSIEFVAFLTFVLLFLFKNGRHIPVDRANSKRVGPIDLSHKA